MSAFASLQISSQAMTTQSHVLGRISGNVANINTIGYKSFDAHLQDMVSSSDGTGSYMSVTAVDVRQTEDQGFIQTTGRSLDVAINGQGYFITNSALDGTDEQHFTRNGATQTVVAGDDGEAYLVTLDGQFYQGWVADEDGTIDTTGALESIQVSTTDGLAGQATTAITYAANVDPNDTVGHTFETRVWSNPDENGENDPYSLVMTWTPDTETENTWTVSYAVRSPDGTTTAMDDTTTVTFSGLGTYATPTEDIVLTVPFEDGTDTTVTLDLTGMTQYGYVGYQEHYQDSNGYSEATLSDIAFNASGQLLGQYTNGEERVLAQLAIADFPAPQNLIDVGATSFRYSQEAGVPEIYAPDGTLTRTTLVPLALESSTVDVATEFTSMITTQKAYSSAATIFRTSDEMIQVAADLKR